jgi:hypothetical protein
MATREDFRLRTVNEGEFRIGFAPRELWVHAADELVVRISAEVPRLRAGRLLAERFAGEVNGDSRVKGVWLFQSGGESLVTVLAERLDEELEFRLYDAFESLAAEQRDVSVGDLAVYDADKEIPGGAPKGDLVGATAQSAGSPQTG